MIINKGVDLDKHIEKLQKELSEYKLKNKDLFDKNNILLNSIKCNHCNTIMYSRFRNDFAFCPCTKCAIDGGLEYLKRSGNQEDWTELSIWDDGLHKTRRENMFWGRYFNEKNERLPMVEYILIKDLNTEHIKNILTNVKHLSLLYREVMLEELKQRNG